MVEFSYTGNVERRKFLRLPLKYSIRHCRFTPQNAERPFESTTLNIGGGGLLFLSSKPYSLGDLLNIEIDIPDWEKFIPGALPKDPAVKSGPFSAKAIVTRADSSGGPACTVAAAFVDLDRQKLWALMFAINKR